jgi:hypothetical protein
MCQARSTIALDGADSQNLFSVCLLFSVLRPLNSAPTGTGNFLCTRQIEGKSNRFC